MLGCIQPMSSPMMNRMFGFRPDGVFCCAVTPFCCAAGVAGAAGDAPLSRSFGGSWAADDVLEASQPTLANETIAARTADGMTESRTDFCLLIVATPFAARCLAPLLQAT